ncbi:uncharacterized protein LOC126579247 [Anopheles aquasalis]|uniref:uncharacterized protein LOC126579247 n=1 Tax=Anopheles aquasalis TaxID=42839 RepID=UPI00215A969A|nr:uncharacterized protein LOC126579247 [Anopheles aquasalis]
MVITLQETTATNLKSKQKRATKSVAICVVGIEDFERSTILAPIPWFRLGVYPNHGTFAGVISVRSFRSPRTPEARSRSLRGVTQAAQQMRSWAHLEQTPPGSWSFKTSLQIETLHRPTTVSSPT